MADENNNPNDDGGELGGFDPNQHKSNRDPIPAGEYPFIVTKCEMKKTANGDYKAVTATFQVLSGAHQNRNVFGHFNIECLASAPTANQKQAVTIGSGDFSDLCKAVGILKPGRCAAFVGKKFLGKVKIAKDKKGNRDDQNEITRFKPFDASKVAAGAGASSGGKPATDWD